ncbi:MAG: hypothetical protein JST70_14590 [Bacteroidetes bacterium]|nr:hypothetical protein [Bacteroidota bacterium]
MDNTQQSYNSAKENIITEKKAWIAPALIEESVSETKGGGITDILENGFYHT